MPLGEAQIERFARHIIIPRFGTRGQERLLQSRVSVFGQGCAAERAAIYLRSAGVQTTPLMPTATLDLNDANLVVACETSNESVAYYAELARSLPVVWFTVTEPTVLRGGVAPFAAVQGGQAVAPTWLLETAASDAAATACALLAEFPVSQDAWELRFD